MRWIFNFTEAKANRVARERISVRNMVIDLSLSLNLLDITQQSIHISYLNYQSKRLGGTGTRVIQGV